MTNQRLIAVFGSSMTEPGTEEWEAAESVGRRLAQAGFGVATGGYAGTMEAACKGSSEAGGRAVGVTAPSLFPMRTGANPYVTEEVEAPTLSDRIGTLIRISSGTISMPGSIGTAAELITAWNTNHLARRMGNPGVPSVAVGEAWRTIAAEIEGQLGARLGDIHLVDTGDDAVDWIVGNAK